MSAQPQILQELVKKLPQELEQEVTDFVLFLLEKRVPKPQPLNLNWRGGLKEFRDEYSSVELQHKSMDWWSD
jgi:Protein of unknown function (DUF2281)